MTESKGIAALKAFLETQNVGPIADEKRVARLIMGAWDELEISDHTNMRAEKLWRMEIRPRGIRLSFCSISSGTAPQ